MPSYNSSIPIIYYSGIEEGTLSPSFKVEHSYILFVMQHYSIAIVLIDLQDAI